MQVQHLTQGLVMKLKKVVELLGGVESKELQNRM